jgi:hypothetical protein
MITDFQKHILTNHHVAGRATQIEVLLSHGQHCPAKWAGTDLKTDFAIIHIGIQGSLSHVKSSQQYTASTKFNGLHSNCDGFGREASDNNTLYFLLWLMF